MDPVIPDRELSEPVLCEPTRLCLVQDALRTEDLGEELVLRGQDAFLFAAAGANSLRLDGHDGHPEPPLLRVEFVESGLKLLASRSQERLAFLDFATPAREPLALGLDLLLMRRQFDLARRQVGLQGRETFFPLFEPLRLVAGFALDT